jgi:HSP20 family protein
MAKYFLNPWGEILGMKEKVDRIMETTFREAGTQGREPIVLWQPVADVYETPESYVIQVELPGVARDAVHLEVQDQRLRLMGERRMEKDASGSAYQVLERSYGPFSREFNLPEGVDPAKISAIYQDGLLTIVIAKSNQARTARRITISGD